MRDAQKTVKGKIAKNKHFFEEKVPKSDKNYVKVTKKTEILKSDKK